MEALEDFDELPYYFEVKCDYCGKSFTTTKQRYLNNKTQCCSRECASKLKKAPPNCQCVICGKQIHVKQSHLNKIQNITCSYDCSKELRKQTMAGENNHQYGLKGDKNPTFKGGRLLSTWGYWKIYNPNHPMARRQYVFEHRLVAEKYLLDDQNSFTYKGKKFLSEDYIVHHIDFDKLNNDIYNLAVLKKNEHIKYHNSLNEIIRDEYGKIKQQVFHNKTMTKEQLRNHFLNYIDNNNIYCNMFKSIDI